MTFESNFLLLLDSSYYSLYATQVFSASWLKLMELEVFLTLSFICLVLYPFSSAPWELWLRFLHERDGKMQENILFSWILYKLSNIEK